MIICKVDTIWQGKVAIRNKYVNECQEKGEMLRIVHDKGQMTIEPRLIHRRIIGYSEGLYDDKFGSGERHRLVYFRWTPDAQQGSLI